MKRDEWEFGYTGKELAEAATKKRDHHKERLAWWQQKKKEKIKEVKATGIDVNDSVAGTAASFDKTGYSMSNTQRGNAPTISIAVHLQRDLQEIHSKIIEHAGRVREYGGWLQVMKVNGSGEFKLNNDDWLFFFGSWDPKDELQQ